MLQLTPLFCSLFLNSPTRNDPNYDSEEEEAAAAAALVYQTPAASRVKAEVEAYKEEVGGCVGGGTRNPQQCKAIRKWGDHSDLMGG